MKPILALLAVLLGSVAYAQATVTLPPATPEQVILTWTASTGCSSTAPCTYQVYRATGTCPSTLPGSTGWTPLAPTASQAVTQTDLTVAFSTTYSYVVEAVQGAVNSGPSNCITIATPPALAAPTGLTGNAT